MILVLSLIVLLLILIGCHIYKKYTEKKEGYEPATPLPAMPSPIALPAIKPDIITAEKKEKFQNATQQIQATAIKLKNDAEQDDSKMMNDMQTKLKDLLILSQQAKDIKANVEANT
jgi:hypothetical protein